jgi:hypothetical protein
LESFSLAGLPLLIGGTQIGRAALPRYFNLGKTVAIVGEQPNTWRKRDEARLFCGLPLKSEMGQTLPFSIIARADIRSTGRPETIEKIHVDLESASCRASGDQRMPFRRECALDVCLPEKISVAMAPGRRPIAG